MRKCRQCKIPLTDENWLPSFRKLPSHICAACSRVERKKYANPRVTILRSARHRAKIKGLPFDLELDDITIPEKCPVLGLTLTTGTISDTSATLDRVRPELGYVKGNVVIICHLANRIKSNATPEQVRAVADWCENVHRLRKSFTQT